MDKSVLVIFLNLFVTSILSNSIESYTETATAFQQNVPLYITNLTSKATSVVSSASSSLSSPIFPKSNTNVSSIKVPLKRNGSLELHLNSLQSSSNVFLTQYNKQNVIRMSQNIDERLQQMKDSEMFITTIQEIFDTFHLLRSNGGGGSLYQIRNKINNKEPSLDLMKVIDEDLKIFSQRISKKLQKAINIVRTLNEFFLYNVTKALQNNLEDEEIDNEYDLDNDENFERLENFESFSSYINTVIESFDKVQKQNYNKQQIQILNYIKTDKNVKYLDSRSLALNNLVEEEVHSLKISQSFGEYYSDISLQLQMNNRNKLVANHYKHIYFLSSSDGATDSKYNYNYDSHFRHLFASAIKRKFVFLLIDIGSAMSPELMELTRQYVSQTLNLLSSNDLISIVTISQEADYIYLDLYPTEAAQGVYTSSHSRKEEILLFMNNLNPSNTIANHVLGFEYSFDMLKRFQNETILNEEIPISFVYITRGLLTNLSTASQVLQIIANSQKELKNPIIINTCAVVLDEKRIMHEKQFLLDISHQNFGKYNIKTDNTLSKMSKYLGQGKLYILTKNHPDLILQASLGVFESFFIDKYVNDGFDVHIPEMDPQNKDVIVSITKAIVPYGVVGVDLYLSDLVEDFVNYHRETMKINSCSQKYAFLIDRKNGITLTHPAFPRPLTQNQNSFPVDISYLENATDFSTIRHKLMHEETGIYTTKAIQTNNMKQEMIQKTYVWKSILGIYVLCLVVTNKTASCGESLGGARNWNNNKSSYNLPVNTPLNPQRSLSKDLCYHRLDLLVNVQTKNCKYFRQIATMESPTLFLSSLAFESPFTFLINNRLNSVLTQTRVMESIMGYLKDTTGLLANPGLRSGIRREVNAVYAAMEQLKQRHFDSRKNLGNSIVRRYIATVSGVLQIYPGCLLTDDYDPTLRPWYRRAMQHPGKIIATEPYVDAGGAGHIITIAHTIFEGKPHGMHSVEMDEPFAVVAIDVPYTFFYKLILETTPLCQQLNIKCLLFDNEGYLIAHPTMLEPSSLIKNQRRPQEHVTHKESFLANDILNHKILVKKLACANFQNHTLQRYYVFNTSLSETLSNVIHSERTKYALALIRGTNIFAVVLNSTADGGAFCPCSTIDRICLNCNRMDQNDCECPCECPMTLDIYDETLGNIDQPSLNYTLQYDYCLPPTETFIAIPPIGEQNLPSCLSSSCEIYITQYDCIGVIGCEWCQQDFEGNIFPTPFCALQTTCFNGILSANTPYGVLDELDLLAARGYIPSQNPSSYSFFGPVGGAIIVLGIVIGLAIYCYRHNIDSSTQDQFYIDSLQEENYGLPLSRFNFDDCQAHDDPPDGGYDHHAVQRTLNPADISPYHMSTGSSYRRPTNGESDHGYSTMTPHEDSSEHQCFALAEPLLLNDKRNSKSDTLSISTSISSPTNRHHHHHNQQQQNNPHSLYPSKSKDNRYNITTPRKLHQNSSPSRVYEQTTIPCNHKDSRHDSFSPHYILAPVTVHRHMEPSET